MLKFAEYSLIDPLQEQRRATSQSGVTTSRASRKPPAALHCNSLLPLLPPALTWPDHRSQLNTATKLVPALHRVHRDILLREIEQQLANAGENHRPGMTVHTLCTLTSIWPRFSCYTRHKMDDLIGTYHTPHLTQYILLILAPDYFPLL